MANWCNNEVDVCGDTAEIKRFKDFMKSEETDFDFERVVSPKESKDLARIKWNSLTKKEKDKWTHNERSEEEAFDKYWFNEGGNGYEWCRDNWGTKWNTSEVSVSESEGSIHYSFDTAWCEPNKIYEKMVELFPKLSFHIHYCEDGVGFEGRLEGKDGVLEETEYYEYEFADCPKCECSGRRIVGEEVYTCDECGEEFKEKEKEE